MPIFDYKCQACGYIEKDVLVRFGSGSGINTPCPKCGDFMYKMPSVPNMHLFPIGGIHLKNVCPGGKTFHSRREMQKYAKKNDLELGALL